jgi:hypothetical protein
MPYPLRSPADRERLDVRDKPYFTPLNDGVHLGYRKGKFKRSWVIRWKTETGYRTETVIGVEPDDEGTGAGTSVLGFDEMEKRIMADEKYHCSFCGKSSKVVEKLVAGPGVYICNRCHEIAGIYMDIPSEGRALKLDEDGRAVRDAGGEPVFEGAG